MMSTTIKLKQNGSFTHHKMFRMMSPNITNLGTEKLRDPVLRLCFRSYNSMIGANNEVDPMTF